MNYLKYKQFFICMGLGLFLLNFPFSILQAQDGSPAKKAKIRLSLAYFNNIETGAYLEAAAKTKVDKSYVPVVGEELHFYSIGEEDVLLGKAPTNKKGVSRLPLKSVVNLADSVFIHSFSVKVENSPRFKNKSEQLVMSESDMEVSFQGDSLHQIAVKLISFDSSGMPVAVSDAPVKVYVKRLFGLLPVGEDMNMTDESGEVVIDFPNDIPGNESGELEVVIKLEEHEKFGSLIYEKKIGWGIPLADNSVISERELWSARSNTPIYLIVLVNTILAGIWGTIAYIIYQLTKITKISRDELDEYHSYI